MDLTTVQVVALPVGGAVLYITLKFLWPLIKSSMNTQLAHGRTESGLLNQALIERDKALARADAADDRADKYFMELADMKTQVQLLTLQLRLANEKIDAMTQRLNELLQERS